MANLLTTLSAELRERAQPPPVATRSAFGLRLTERHRVAAEPARDRRIEIALVDHRGADGTVALTTGLAALDRRC